jgi:hypothetical protein
MARSIIFVFALLTACPAIADTTTPKQDLAVAVFAYTPDAFAAAKAVEAAFEKQNPGIDVDIDLIDPYSIGLGAGEIFQDTKVDGDLSKYDVVEIDICRLNDIRAHLDKLPASVRGLGAPYAKPVADALVKPNIAEFVSPHWACGNLVVSWTSANLKDVDTFAEIRNSMNGTAGSAVLSDFYGGTTLGEYYADWLVDHYGEVKAREALRALGAKPVPAPTPDQLNDPSWKANPLQKSDIDPKAVEDFRAMVLELHADYVKQLSRFHGASDAYPRRFEGSSEKGSLLVGYSERLYFVGVQRSLDPNYDSSKLVIGAEEVDVRPLAFGDRSQGTPVWIDGFVVPAGKLSPKQDAIEKFLKFASAPEAYAIFRQPAGYGPAAHLLPVPAAEYEGAAIEKCPALPEFRDALKDPFVLDDSDVWRGIKYSGEILKAEVKDAAKQRP